jgi:hypothetical protein
MGKTIAKQRKKAAKAAQEEDSKDGGRAVALKVIAKTLKYKLPASPLKKVKLQPLISCAMQAGSWPEAEQLLAWLEDEQAATAAAAAASKGPVKGRPPQALEAPKLGTIMRWVR